MRVGLAPAQTPVWTAQYDDARTAANLSETLTGGHERFNGPVAIQGYVPGTVPDARNGDLAFTPGNVL
jgi:hypothetical protein